MTIAIQGKNNRGRNNAKALQTEEQVAAAVEAAKQLGGERQEVQVEETSSISEVPIVEAPVEDAPEAYSIPEPEQAPEIKYAMDGTMCTEPEYNDGPLDIFTVKMSKGLAPSVHDQLKLLTMLETVTAENLHPYVQMKLWDLGQKTQPWLCSVSEDKEWAPRHQGIKEALEYHLEHNEIVVTDISHHDVEDMVATMLSATLVDIVKEAMPSIDEEKISSILDKAKEALSA